MKILPAKSTLLMLCGMIKPSETGTVCATPSPMSKTTPVVLPAEYKDITACIPDFTQIKIKMKIKREIRKRKNQCEDFQP